MRSQVRPPWKQMKETAAMPPRVAWKEPLDACFRLSAIAGQTKYTKRKDKGDCAEIGAKELTAQPEDSKMGPFAEPRCSGMTSWIIYTDRVYTIPKH